MPDDDDEYEKVMKKVTHLCVDRPIEGQAMQKSKEYVQPQYVVDSLNNLFLLPTKAYAPGQAAPAHLSPFVDNVAEGYIPDRQREINALAGVDEEVMTGGRRLKATGAIGSDSEADDDEAEEEEKAKDEDEDDGDAKGDLDSSSDEEDNKEDDDESEDEQPKKAKGKTESRTSKVIQKKVLTRAEQAKKNEKIKRDLKKEQEELGKMLMTNR